MSINILDSISDFTPPSPIKAENKNKGAAFFSVVKAIYDGMTKSSSAEEKAEKRSKKEAEKACVTEAKNAYTRQYGEIRDRALQQGYSKTEANKLAKEEAYKIYTQTLEECTNGSSDNPSSNTSNQNSSTPSDGNW